MIVITVARKPVEGTVSGNVLKHGTGALNINGSRISFASEADRMAALPGSMPQSNRSIGTFQTRDRSSEKPEDFQKATGRWPANVIFEHKPECRRVGTQSIGYGERRKAAPGTAKPFNPDKGWNEHPMTREGQTAPENYGAETVPVWSCLEGCPIADLDEQTGLTSSTPHNRGNRGNHGRHDTGSQKKEGTESVQKHTDTPGGASRFFFTFQNLLPR